MKVAIQETMNSDWEITLNSNMNLIREETTLQERIEVTDDRLLRKQRISCRSKVAGILKLISFGKYRTPLYYKGSDSYSSVMGGIFTIIGMIILLCFCVYIL